MQFLRVLGPFLCVLLLVACGDDDSTTSGTGGAGGEGGIADAAIEPGTGGMGGGSVDPGAPQCSDGEDNDGDGLTDLDDPGCENARDDDEIQRLCADGIDNDQDGLIDFPADPGCGSAEDNDEFNAPRPPECADGIDNDLNGYVDEYDPGCSSVADPTEAPADAVAACSDRIDNDQDGVTDFPQEPGCGAAGDDDETDPPGSPACTNGADDDLDGLIDYPEDPGCAGRGDRDESEKPVTPDCADGVDNDRDGRTDYPADDGCDAASDYSEKGSCLEHYDPPRIVGGTPLQLDSSRGIFRSQGSCGGQGSPELVVLYRLEHEIEGFIVSTIGEGTSSPSTIYVRKTDCLLDVAEVACGRETPDAFNPGQSLTIENPELGEYFIFVDGVAGAGGPIELSVTEIPVSQCRNGIDDDEDGVIDYPVEPGCVDGADRDETDPAEAPVCANGVDDDEDGQTDYPADPGCIAASWADESDLCGAGIAISEYAYGSQGVFGDTGDETSTNVMNSRNPQCASGNRSERIYLYRNPYQARLRISTVHPETRVNTAVYIRSDCDDSGTELACDNGSGAGGQQGQITMEGVEPGLYYVIVDTTFGLGGPFKLTIDSERDEPECGDFVDNDDDGAIDADDPGCTSPRDRTERNPLQPPACSNQRDDDEDGKTDYPSDPGCEARGDRSEEDPEDGSACLNGIDDDQDGLIDYPLDPGCSARGDLDERDPRIAPQCSNGFDDDRDGDVDFPADFDCDAAGDATEQGS